MGKLAAFLIAIVLLLPLQALGQSEPPVRPVPVIPLASAETRPIVPATMGIIVNGNDLHSIVLASLYAKKRGIPMSNIHIVYLPVRGVISYEELAPAVASVHAWNKSGYLRAYALAWQMPYRAEEQSITSAFSIGVRKLKYSGTCGPTDVSPVYNEPAGALLKIPLTMMLMGGPDKKDVFRLVDEAGSGDGLNPKGTVYLAVTDDNARSKPRLDMMIEAKLRSADKVNMELLRENNLKDVSGIIGFETGKAVLRGLSTLSFLPGAYADSLTSFGGRLSQDHRQTTVAEIMKAGATGSYGTVREPCNFPEKFPRPDLILNRYLAGDTLMEAYWKSVRMITEGLFVGEPLARPFAPFLTSMKGGSVVVQATRLSQAGNYQLYRVETGQPVEVGHFKVGSRAKPGQELFRFKAEESQQAMLFGVVRQDGGKTN